MKRLFFLIFVFTLFSTTELNAASSDELLQMVDSAYNEAMAGRLQQAVMINEDGLLQTPADSIGLRCEFYSCLLYCYHRLGDYEQALHYGEICLQYDEKQGNLTNLSASLGNLAGIYSSAGKYDVAIDYLNRSIAIEEELLQTDKEHTAKSLAIRKAMLGEVLLAKAKRMTATEEGRVPMLEKALRLTGEALRIDSLLDRQLQVGMRLSQMGNIYAELGDIDKARRCYEEALDIARRTNNRMTEVITLLQLGRYGEAADIAYKLGLKKQEAEACNSLYLAAHDKGDSRDALLWLERTRELEQQIRTEETERQLTLWQVRYDTQRKEQQLTKQQQQLEQQKMREWILVLCIALTLFSLALLIIIVISLRKRKNILEQKVLDQEQQYSKLALELKQFYGKDISAILQEIADAKTKNIQDTKLTRREQEIVKLICEGYRGKEIADKLNISIRAVNSHKTNIFNKLGISSSVELVRFALEHGII